MSRRKERNPLEGEEEQDLLARKHAEDLELAKVLLLSTEAQVDHQVWLVVIKVTMQEHLVGRLVVYGFLEELGDFWYPKHVNAECSLYPGLADPALVFLCNQITVKSILILLRRDLTESSILAITD